MSGANASPIGRSHQETTITLEVQYRDKRGELHLDFQPWNGTEMPVHWKSLFRLSRVESRFEDLPLVYSNGGLYNQQWTYWERV